MRVRGERRSEGEVVYIIDTAVVEKSECEARNLRSCSSFKAERAMMSGKARK